MGVSALSGSLTVALFLYILLIPVIKGIPPNVRRGSYTQQSLSLVLIVGYQYRSWRESGELSSVIPVRVFMRFVRHPLDQPLKEGCAGWFFILF